MTMMKQKGRNPFRCHLCGSNDKNTHYLDCWDVQLKELELADAKMEVIRQHKK